ncbi:MAG TPA: GntR family transcriptional regulator [Nevskiaceae bacterium]|nr:GntR family transcriptional regulator [Nevskiaceae bacterium]
MITFRLSRHSGVPPYLQIVQQVKHSLQMGILLEGDKLPTVKEVVTQIGINPNTVFKAYRELEMLGLVEGRTGSGTFARGHSDGLSADIQTKLTAELLSWVENARDAKLDDESIEALVREALHKTRRDT